MLGLVTEPGTFPAWSMPLCPAARSVSGPREVAFCRPVGL